MDVRQVRSNIRHSTFNIRQYNGVPRGVSREWGVVLYGTYAADVILDSSALKDAVVDCSTTWDGSEFQSPTVRTAKE